VVEEDETWEIEWGREVRSPTSTKKQCLIRGQGVYCSTGTNIHKATWGHGGSRRKRVQIRGRRGEREPIGESYQVLWVAQGLEEKRGMGEEGRDMKYLTGFKG